MLDTCFYKLPEVSKMHSKAFGLDFSKIAHLFTAWVQ